MSSGQLFAVRVWYSVKLPPVVIRPILPVTVSPNHSAPSGPVAMQSGPLSAVGIGYSVMLTVAGSPEPTALPAPVLLAPVGGGEASQLHIAQATVEDHVKNIAAKTDAHSRSQIVARVLGFL
jgi:hypothetical protein